MEGGRVSECQRNEDMDESNWGKWEGNGAFFSS